METMNKPVVGIENMFFIYAYLCKSPFICESASLYVLIMLR
jgi:hypothetical protein